MALPDSQSRLGRSAHSQWCWHCKHTGFSVVSTCLLSPMSNVGPLIWISHESTCQINKAAWYVGVRKYLKWAIGYLCTRYMWTQHCTIHNSLSVTMSSLDEDSLKYFLWLGLLLSCCVRHQCEDPAWWLSQCVRVHVCDRVLAGSCEDKQWARKVN